MTYHSVNVRKLRRVGAEVVRLVRLHEGAACMLQSNSASGGVLYRLIRLEIMLEHACALLDRRLHHIECVTGFSDCEQW